MSFFNVAVVVRWPTGGIRTHLKYLYTRLPAGKYRPIVIAPAGVETDFLLANLAGTSVVHQPLETGSPARLIGGIWSALRAAKVDLVHSHGFTSAALAALPARLVRVPHVATIHDVVTPELEKRLGQHGRFALGRALQLATVVQAVGEDAGENLRQKLLTRGFADRRLKVVRNGIDLAQFTDVQPRGLRAELGVGDDTFIVGFMGRFMAQKGFRTLIDAVDLMRRRSQARGLRVVAVGDGGFIREDRAEVERRALQPYFSFLPPVENAAPTMAALDCLVMPSRWEAYSVLAGEALSLGVPLIASDCIGLREAVVDTPARMFPAGDAEELATAIEQEMQDPSRRRCMDFVAEARQRFDVQNAAVAMDAIFSGLLDVRPDAPRG